MFFLSLEIKIFCGSEYIVEQGNLELGELEQLTINNDNDVNYDQLTAPKVSLEHLIFSQVIYPMQVQTPLLFQ